MGFGKRYDPNNFHMGFGKRESMELDRNDYDSMNYAPGLGKRAMKQKK